MSEKHFKMSIARTKATGIILEKELSTDEVYDELMRLDEENKEFKQENEELKQQISYYEKIITDKEVEWLRDNTVWEQMPSSKRTFTKTTFER